MQNLFYYLCAIMFGIYVHIPFCASRCTYCDFYSTLYAEPERSLYLNAVIDESSRRCCENKMWLSPAKTLYVGGGTPSQLSPSQLQFLLSGLRNIFDLNHVEEMTIEVNPDDVTEDAASAWRHMGFNRVSVGVQSLVDAELNRVNRRHNSSTALSAIETLQQAGFDNISVDLIFGLPEQTVTTLAYTVTSLVESGVTHISAYNLSYEPGTVLWKQREHGMITQASDELCVEMYHLVSTTLRENGFEHYEISNYAKPGFRSRHNSAYWRFTPYLGLGAGAHGYDGHVRYYNRTDIKGYINGDVTEVEHLTARDCYNERIMLGLRTIEGIDLRSMGDALGTDAVDELLAGARSSVNRGLLEQGDGYLKLTPEAVMVSDNIISELFK